MAKHGPGHSADMLNRNYFSHTDPQGRSLKDRLPANLSARQWGENIWTGSGYDTRQSHNLAQKVIVGWMNSPGHRKNILDPGYTHLGVGVMSKNQEVKATQVFIGMAGAGISPSPGFPEKMNLWSCRAKGCARFACHRKFPQSLLLCAEAETKSTVL